MMTALLFTGRAGSGKTTSALETQKALAERGYTSLIYHIADTVKFIATKCYGWDGYKDNQGRKLLQTVGTDVYHNAVSPNIWSDFLLNIIDGLNAENSPVHYDFILIPDCRLVGELRNFQTATQTVEGVKLVKTYSNRPSKLTKEQQEHKSELGIPAEEVDFFLSTDAPLGSPEFRQSIDEMLDYLYGI